jgi:hydroxyethylthiazole kinase-like uncharacterized protein yjeF
MKVSRVSEMRSLDRAAIGEFGIPADLLMENAGHAVYFAILKEFGIEDKQFLVFCGTGNNGGDGLVVARKIHSNGGTVKVFILGDPGRFTGPAKINLDIVLHLPVEVQQVESTELLRMEIERCDAIVDALFGTGLSRDVGGVYREVIELVNDSHRTVFSVDIPSGVHGDTGEVMGVAIKADYTVTFGLPKLGNMLFPGYDLGGKLYVSHISFPPSLYTADDLKVAINDPARLPPRDKRAHQGDFGEVLFIAGAAGYFGPPYFAALSFLKAGGRCARLAVPKSMVPFLASKAAEIALSPQKETGLGSISFENKRALLELSKRADMVVLGPGLGLEEETHQLARDLAAEINKPLLIDGDGIAAVWADLNIIRQRKAETILTLHPGEMSKITGMCVGDVDTQKINGLQRITANLGAVIVLKGAHSLVGHPDERVFINLSGNRSMATAGVDELLAGTIIAMFGLGLPLQYAVRQGVFIHGLAGDLAAAEKGEDGITAQDILDYLPLALKVYREGLNESLRERYAGMHII